MTALVQGCAGLALVMAFALLRTRQTGPAAMLLAIQAAAVAIAALGLGQPVMAIPSIILTTLLWLSRPHTARLDPRTDPVGGTKLCIGVAAALAILSQSQGSQSLPLAILLLAVLLAATRTHRLMQAVSLAAMQNAVVLAACLAGRPPSMVLTLDCLALPLPLAAGLLVPASRLPSVRTLPGARWIDLSLPVIVLAAALTAPLDPVGAVFAPLLALDGVFQAVVRWQRGGLTPAGRAIGLARGTLIVAVVSAPTLAGAWIALLAAVALYRLPALRRRWPVAVLSVSATGIALFGIVLLPSLLGYFSLFAGFAAVAATVPELSVALTVLVLRSGIQHDWSMPVQAIATGVALAGLAACALLLSRHVHRASVLSAAACCLAVATIAIGQPAAFVAALVLLALLVLCRSAARGGIGRVAAIGVLPGLVQAVWSIASFQPWLLIPIGLTAVMPSWRLDASNWPTGIRLVFWFPLLLAVLAGYAAPDGLVRWLQLVVAPP